MLKWNFIVIAHVTGTEQKNVFNIFNPCKNIENNDANMGGHNGNVNKSPGGTTFFSWKKKWKKEQENGNS